MDNGVATSAERMEAEWLSQAASVELKTGDIVIRQGRECRNLYRLEEGRLAVVLNMGAEAPDDEAILRASRPVAVLSEPRTFFGEGGLFEKRRTASVVCLSPTARITALNLAGGGWSEMVSHHGGVALSLCRKMAARESNIITQIRSYNALQEASMRAVKHYAEELVELVERADTALKKRVFTQVDVELRRLTQDLHAFRHRALYRHGATVHSDTSVNLVKPVERIGPKLFDLEPGELFFREGDPGTSLYLLVRGEMEILIGKETVGRIHGDQFVGVVSMLQPDVSIRCDTVRALTPCRLGRVCDTYKEFEQLVQGEHWLLSSIGQGLMARIRAANRVLLSRVDSLKEAIATLGLQGESCDTLFKELADLLDRHDTTREYAARARAAALRARSMRESLQRELSSRLSTQYV